MSKKQLRPIDAPFVALGPSGVAIRDRLKHLTTGDDKVLRLVGGHLGNLALLDLKARCADGNEHSTDTWAARKQGLTAASSSRWAGSITKATHDQWALSRRCQLAHIQSLEAGVRTLMHRLSQPVGERALSVHRAATAPRASGSRRPVGCIRWNIGSTGRALTVTTASCTSCAVVDGSSTPGTTWGKPSSPKLSGAGGGNGALVSRR